MALVRCPECRGTVSTRAEVCPHCGNPLDAQPSGGSREETFTPEILRSATSAALHAEDFDTSADVALPSNSHEHASVPDLAKPTLSLLPEPRSYFGTAVMFAAMTALPFGVLWSVLFAIMMQIPIGPVLMLGLPGGAFFGILFGLTIAFSFKGETATVEILDKRRFISRLNIAMSEIGYNPATQSPDFFTFKPSLQAGLLAGRIAVQLRDGCAVMVGPKMYLQKLLKRLTPIS
jgi:hypothetical protein